MSKQSFLFLSLLLFLFASCSPFASINRSAQQNVLNDSALRTAHVGISVWDADAGRYLYNYQGDKYFVPASNTKLPTCYAAMKYLGDSLVAARIAVNNQEQLTIFPSGDPTFLNTEFPYQPLFEKLKGYKTVYLSQDQWQEQRWGSGWSWNDYDASYMAERSPFPMYGNVANFRLSDGTLKIIPQVLTVDAATEVGFQKASRTVASDKFKIERSLDDNDFLLLPSSTTFSTVEIPIRTDVGLISSLLEDTLKTPVAPSTIAKGYTYNPSKRTIHSQPTDSLLKPMMHRSDNFFAEQSLLMVSNEVLGIMNDQKIIDTLLKTDFKDLPQKPRWADGSGLSRYNLFTPQDFVAILNKMRVQFGIERMKEILPTGNEGTLTNYYKTGSGYIFAKTGTLSGVVALSGFLYSRKNKLLIFSVLVNNHQASATAVRRAVERFIEGVRNEY